MGGGEAAASHAAWWCGSRCSSRWCPGRKLELAETEACAGEQRSNCWACIVVGIEMIVRGNRDREQGTENREQGTGNRETYCFMLETSLVIGPFLLLFPALHFVQMA